MNMDKWFGVDAQEQAMLGLSHGEKKHLLFLRQKKTLELFVERGAISHIQFEALLRDLCQRMEEVA